MNYVGCFVSRVRCRGRPVNFLKAGRWSPSMWKVGLGLDVFPFDQHILTYIPLIKQIEMSRSCPKGPLQLSHLDFQLNHFNLRNKCPFNESGLVGPHTKSITTLTLSFLLVKFILCIRNEGNFSNV